MLELFKACEFRGTDGSTLKYRLLKPQAALAQQTPLVVFLHGAGERGDDNCNQLIHGVAEFTHPERLATYPCYVIAPQCPTGQKWVEVDWSSSRNTMPETISQPLRLVLELVDDFIDSGRVDENRIYLTGLSMGGYGTWDALARRSNFFAAAVPICGGGDPTKVTLFKDVPIWSFHGDVDAVVPVSRSREMIEALRMAGASPKYTEYAGVQHDSWTQTYRTPELYRWMFAQQRSVS